MLKQITLESSKKWAIFKQTSLGSCKKLYIQIGSFFPFHLIKNSQRQFVVAIITMLKKKNVIYYRANKEFIETNLIV